MTLELRPLGVACNLACTYCYQEPLRQSGNSKPKYDIDKMLAEAEKMNQPFNLFGGEALLIPKKHLRKFWQRGLELHGSNGVQTNGTLIDDEHIEMFKEYKVGVGVSIDGPNELNGLREVRGKAGNHEATLDSTKVIMDNIVKLVDNNISVGIIITLHKLNGSRENLPRLLQFMRWLGDLGISGNIHTLEVDATMPDQEIHVLSPEDNAEAFLTIAKFLENNTDLRYSPFTDMEDSMKNNDEDTICIWNRCDALNTQAVYGIEGDGGLSNCGRTAKEGIDWYKAEGTGYERYISLYNTPDELGGCGGCRFFMLCSGSCPGEAIDNDFRNKTIHCGTKKALLGHYEQKALDEGITPFSLRDDRKEMESRMMDDMIAGRHSKISRNIRDISNTSIMQVEVREG